WPLVPWRRGGAVPDIRGRWYRRSVPTATVDGLSIAYELLGEAGRPWAVTPGARYHGEAPGVRELAQALADAGQRVLLWDRPNTGASDVCFRGDTESEMQA